MPLDDDGLRRRHRANKSTAEHELKIREENKWL